MQTMTVQNITDSMIDGFPVIVEYRQEGKQAIYKNTASMPVLDPLWDREVTYIDYTYQIVTGEYAAILTVYEE